MKLPTDIIPSHPSYDLKTHVAHVQSLYAKYPYRTRELCDAAMPGIMQKISPRYPEQIASELAEAVHSTLSLADVFQFKPPQREEREYLRRMQTAFSDPHWPQDGIAATVELFKLVVSRFPASVFAEAPGTMRVPLYELVADLPDLIMRISHHALKHHGKGFGFELLAWQLNSNAIVASGYDPDNYEGRPLTYAHEAKMPPAQLIHAYLGGTPFEDLLSMQVSFVIPRKTWASHAIVLAPPNHGKTQLLGSLVAGFLKDPNPVGCFVLDPHGDLFAALKERVEPSRLVLLDPDTDPPPLNFLDFGHSTDANTLQTFSYLMSSLSGGLSDKQGAIVPYLLKLLRRLPLASLDTLRTIVDEKVKRPDQSVFWPAIQLLDPVDQGFFHSQFYSSRMQETKDAIGWKLYAALSSDAFRKMFSATSNSIDFDKAISDRKIVLVKGARNALGDEGMRVFLQFIVAQYFAAGLRRESIPPDQRHLCMMLVDEAHTVMDSPIISNILVELRKYACGYIGATQVLHQIAEDVKHAVYGATAVKISGPVSHNDAVQLAREMYTSPEFIRSMKARERQGADWAFYVQNVTPHAIRVTVPYGQLEAMPKTHEAPLQEPHATGFAVQSSQYTPQTQTAPVVPRAASDVLPPPESRGDKEILDDDPARARPGRT